MLKNYISIVTTNNLLNFTSYNVLNSLINYDNKYRCYVRF